MAADRNENAFIYSNATLGIYGTKVLSSGETSDAAHEFLAVTAVEDSVISYVKSSTTYTTYGDATVTNLSISNGLTLILGTVKTINVVSGKIVANLIDKP